MDLEFFFRCTGTPPKYFGDQYFRSQTLDPKETKEVLYFSMKYKNYVLSNITNCWERKSWGKVR